MPRPHASALPPEIRFRSGSRPGPDFLNASRSPRRSPPGAGAHLPELRQTAADNDNGRGPSRDVLNLEKPMHLYRFHFLDAAGAVVHRHSAQLPTDAAAVQMGQRMLVDREQACSLEIWHLNRLVHSEDRSSGTVVKEPCQIKK